jgi:hypothetical protein
MGKYFAKKADGWWLVQYEKQRGWFPSNHLVEVNRKKETFVLFQIKFFFRKHLTDSILFHY